MTGKLIMIAGDTWERARVLFMRRLAVTPAAQIRYVRYTSGAERMALVNGDRIITGSLRSPRSLRGFALDVVEVEHELTDEQSYAILPCLSVTGGRVIVSATDTES
jgi:hypothetical protein